MRHLLPATTLLAASALLGCDPIIIPHTTKPSGTEASSSGSPPLPTGTTQAGHEGAGSSDTSKPATSDAHGGSTTGLVATSTTSADPATTTGPSTSGALESSSGGGHAGWACAPAPAAGWSGPFLLARGPADQALPCPDGYEAAAPTFRGLLVSPSTCECQCGDPEGMSCDEPGRALFFFESDACDEVTSATVATGDCSNTAAPSDTAIATDSVDPSGLARLRTGTCPPRPTALHPAPTWEEQVLACERPVVLKGHRACLAHVPETSALCIARAGARACPTAYPVRSQTHTAYADDRSCAPACECSSAFGGCAVFERFFADPGCTGAELPPADDGCQIGVGSIALSLGEPNGSCFATPSEPTGAVEPIDPITYCCTG